MSVTVNVDRIRSRREELGLTQEESARRAGLSSKQAWQGVESGARVQPSAETICRMAIALSLRMEDLMDVKHTDTPGKARGKGK